MKIYCTIVVDDAKQREQVCECANRLGGAPCMGGSTVNVMLEYGHLKSAKYLAALKEFIDTTTATTTE